MPNNSLRAQKTQASHTQHISAFPLSSTATWVSLFLIHDKSKIVAVHVMKAYVKVQLQVHSFVNLALGGGGQILGLATLTPRKGLSIIH
jgi:hypothetical protein